MNQIKKRIKSETQISDEELLIRIAERDKAALQELYQRYRSPLGSFLNRRIYDTKLVDEAFNDVMFAVWNKAAGFRGDSKASTWIFGIAYRVGLSVARKESKHTDKRSDVDPYEMDIETSQDVNQSHEQDNEHGEELRLAIGKLKDNHKAVIELAYFQHHSMDEIAEIVGVPTNTVKTRLFHARRYLKEQLERNTSAGF